MVSLIDVYPLESVAPEPWRNGGGVTRTLATGGADWRVSLASIERNGPYSRFPGIDRVSLVLSGNGVSLTGTDVVVRLGPWIAAEYDGDADWHATLIDGPSLALNVMTRKDRYRASVRLVDSPRVVRPGCSAIVIAMDRGCSFAEGPDTRTGDVMPGHVLVSEHHAHALRLAPHAASANVAAHEPYAVLVTIEPVPVGDAHLIFRGT
ncbi:HutD/Ves family protein [Burkholderia aenigmatica]|uniref:HutD/Ves family protein n=1 Tax=Burkholderia aenigmatica TaxID=2015348 RepID=UPI00264C042C|nr:HutD family protein [Burkholderia aenigmatica]MDN7874899.1 HutD family protein [Burkholderia aenigmatica]